MLPLLRLSETRPSLFWARFWRHRFGRFAPVAKAAGVQVVAFSNSHEVAGDGVFILGFVPRQQVQSVVGYAAAEGATRFAVLAPDDDYGRAVVDATRNAVLAGGGSLVRARLYDTAAADYTNLVKDFSGYEPRHRALLAQRKALADKSDEISRQALRRLERVDSNRRTTVRCADFA